MVLVTKELLASIGERHHEDMIQDMFMKIDEWILRSINRWYNERQTYSYIRLAINWFIINYFKFEIGKNYIDTQYDSENNSVNEHEYEIEDMMNLNNIPTLLLDWLHKCTELEMRFILLHHYMSYPVSKIAELTWYKRLNIYQRLKSGMKKIRVFLESKWVKYEDVC